MNSCRGAFWAHYYQTLWFIIWKITVRKNSLKYFWANMIHRRLFGIPKCGLLFLLWQQPSNRFVFIHTGIFTDVYSSKRLLIIYPISRLVYEEIIVHYISIVVSRQYVIHNCKLSCFVIFIICVICAMSPDSQIGLLTSR